MALEVKKDVQMFGIPSYLLIFAHLKLYKYESLRNCFHSKSRFI